MKRMLLTSAAAVAVFALSSGAYAQDEKMFLSKSGDKSMVMGGANADGTELLMGDGAKPGECPAGHFYTTDASQQMVMRCDDDAQFTLAAPESGAMRSGGEPYPEGSMIMTPAQ